MRNPLIQGLPRKITGNARSAIAVATAAIALFGVTHPTLAKDGDVFQDWTMRCEDASEDSPELCGIVQIGKDDESGRDVLRISIGYNPNVPDPLGVVDAPLGIFLPPGVLLQVDQGKELRIPYRFCRPEACSAVFPINSEILSAFKKGVSLNVTLENQFGKTKTIPLSLRGFTAGLNSLPKP